MFGKWLSARARPVAGLWVAVVIAIATAHPAVASDKTETLIYIFGGQSNMVGTTIARKVKDAAQVKERIYYSDTKGGNRFPDGRDQRNQLNFGPEYGFIKTLEANGIKNFIVQKTAHGGTSIYPRTEPGRLDWHPDTKGELFDIMVRDYHTLVKKIKSEGKTPVLQGIFWAQGAADSRHDVSVYPRNLAYFFDSLQSELGQKTDIYLAQSNWPELERLQKFADDMQVVRDTQQAYADARPNADIVSTKGYTKVDKVHFDPKSSFDLGTRFARMYFDMNGIKGYALPAPSSNLVNAKHPQEFYDRKLKRGEQKTRPKRKQTEGN